MKIEYAIIVINKTRLELLIDQYNSISQARFYIESLGGNFENYQVEHEVFYSSLNKIKLLLSSKVKFKILPRNYLPSFIFSEDHVIIAVGQDGLVANTAKYSKGIPIVAINPDKSRYDGLLLPFSTDNFIKGIENVLKNTYQYEEIKFAEIILNDGQRIRAFNDLFIGMSNHTSAKYRIRFNDKVEEHSSSGIIVSTKIGSTGWLSSVINMAFGIIPHFNIEEAKSTLQMHKDELYFAVREPFKSLTSGINITFGKFSNHNKLIVESLMPVNGVIFSDGLEMDFIKFNSGSIATIGLSNETTKLVLNK